jgi:hypothetical protein
VSTVVLDAGALIAFERGDRDVTAELQWAVAEEDDLFTTAMVVAQVWRDGARQARLARLLGSVEVVPIDEELGRRTGELLAAAGTTDAVDASLVLVADDGDRLLTSDEIDLRQLVEAAGRRVRVVAC